MQKLVYEIKLHWPIREHKGMLKFPTLSKFLVYGTRTGGCTNKWRIDLVAWLLGAILLTFSKSLCLLNVFMDSAGWNQVQYS